MQRVTMEKFQQVFCDRGPTVHPVDVSLLPDVDPASAPTGVIYRGSTLRVDIYGEFDGYCVGAVLPEGFHEIGEWNNGFRQVFVNDETFTIVTYCEGDIDVTIDKDQAAYALRLRSARAFYEGHS